MRGKKEGRLGVEMHQFCNKWRGYGCGGWGQRPHHLDMKTLCKFPYKFLLCTHSGLNFTMISNKTHMLWQGYLGRLPAAWHFCKGLGTLSCTPEGPGKPLLPTSLIGPLVGQRSRVFLRPEAGSAWWYGQKERWPWCIGGAPLWVSLPPHGAP